MKLAHLIGNVRDGLISLGYPASCTLCGGPVERWNDGVVCGSCWSDPELTWIFEQTLVCVRCGNPLSKSHLQATTASETSEERPRFCGLCSVSPLAASRSCGDYRGALEASVLFLKTTPHLCPRLRKIIEGTLTQTADSLHSDVIAPIPLHPSRLRERGFNQAFVIAKAVSRVLGIPVSQGLLRRTKQTRRHRAGMDPADRARSVQKAFQAARASDVKGRSVLLVDDVLTTGATVGEAASALLESGATRVNCFTIARVVLPRSAAPATARTSYGVHRPDPVTGCLGLHGSSAGQP